MLATFLLRIFGLPFRHLKIQKLIYAARQRCFFFLICNLVSHITERTQKEGFRVWDVEEDNWAASLSHQAGSPTIAITLIN